MSISLKDLRKRKVVDTSTAETIGRVRDIHIDPAGPRVHAIQVKGSRSGVVRFDDIEGIGPDAVTVGAAELVREDETGLPRALSDAVGARLLDDHGHEHGKVRDLSIDESGRIVGVSTAEATHAGTLLGIGSYAVVIERV